MNNALRLCSGCKCEKEEKQFYSRMSYKRAYQCKECEKRKNSERQKLQTKETRRIYRETFKEKNPWAHRKAELKYRYGLTPEDVEEMIGHQMGMCANRGCGRKIELHGTKRKNKACIDHCHASGEIRGLLCNGCNTALGFLEEDKNRILGLTEYLQKTERQRK